MSLKVPRVLEYQTTYPIDSRLSRRQAGLHQIKYHLESNNYAAHYTGGGARSVILKATRSPAYDPTDAVALQTTAVGKEWVACAFLAARAPGRCDSTSWSSLNHMGAAGLAKLIRPSPGGRTS